MANNTNLAGQPETPQARASADLSRRLRRFALTVMPILIGLHAYIGWRLLPALPIGMPGTVVGGLLLGLSALLITLGMFARFLVPSLSMARSGVQLEQQQLEP